MTKKQKLLQKYLDKKDKQKRRDFLISELKKHEEVDSCVINALKDEKSESEIKILHNNKCRIKQSKKENNDEINSMNKNTKNNIVKLNKEAKIDNKLMQNNTKDFIYSANKDKQLKENINIKDFIYTLNKYENEDKQSKENKNTENIIYTANKDANKDKQLKENNNTKDCTYTVNKETHEGWKLKVNNVPDEVTKKVKNNNLQISSKDCEFFCQHDAEKLKEDKPMSFVTIKLANPLIEKIKLNRNYYKRKESVQNKRLEMPICQDEMNIIETIQENDVIFINGETGSGKSTQLPQFILENLSEEGKLIGLTQPRRISAISLTKRINYEVNQNVAAFKIRYEDTTNHTTKIKIMTEGVLMNELRSDFLLSSYSHLLIDEVHEQSAICDVLLPLLNKIILKRKNNKNPLKLIIMSANLNMEKYSSIFEHKWAEVEIMPMDYKVSIFYEGETKVNYLDVALEKIKIILGLQVFKEERGFNYDISRNRHKNRVLRLPENVENNKNCAILVFLPGKDEIYSLAKMIKESKLDVLVLPLHSMLPYTEQELVYKKSVKRKIILATNIAETSITVPEVVFVIDSGRRKYQLYDRNQSFSYIVDFISKSGANQRKGRAGRVSNGVCFRLYSGKFYDQMKDFEIPEIINMPIENMILNLMALGIKNCEDFPFVNPPPKNTITQGYKLLRDIGALEDLKLTIVGEEMVRYPIDVRLSRLLLLKTKFTNELILIIAILSLDLDFVLNEGHFSLLRQTKSLIVTKLVLLIEYYKSFDKDTFVSEHKISEHYLIEIFKLVNYVRKMMNSYEELKFNELHEEEYKEIRKILFCIFCYNLAICNENKFYYDGKEVYLPNKAQFGDVKQIVFTHLVQGNRKLYVNNATAVDEF